MGLFYMMSCQPLCAILTETRGMSSVGIWEEPSRQGIASKSREYSWQVQGTPDQLRLYTQARTCTLPTRPRLQKKMKIWDRGSEE